MDPQDPAENPADPSLLKVGSKTIPNVFVYTDPINGNRIVTGSMTTTITDPGLTMMFAGSTNNLNVRRATVNDFDPPTLTATIMPAVCHSCRDLATAAKNSGTGEPLTDGARSGLMA